MAGIKEALWRAVALPYPWRLAGGVEIPEGALPVTKRAHDNGSTYIWITYFFARVAKKEKKKF